MHVTLQPAHVLHQRPYRETSLLLEVFSLDHGRVGLVARGARRPRSGLRGILQAFRPLLLSWVGRGELMSLTGAEPDGQAAALSGRGLLSGLYVNELLMRLLQRSDPHGGLYGSYRAALAGLAAAGREERVLRVFEKRLLEAIGYGLVLTTDAGSGAPVKPDGRYRYQIEHGPVVDTSGRGTGIPISGQTLLALAEERLDSPGGLREAKSLMRHVLRVYLGDRPLASRELFKEGQARHEGPGSCSSPTSLKPEERWE